LGVEGADIVADALLTQRNLKQLSVDLYFNNITENGTESVSKSILEINNPELRVLNYNLDFNYIKNEGAKAVGKTLSQMVNLRSLTIGVASKNFGYLGFKHIVNGIGHLTNLEELSFKCGINRVGPNGAEITRDLIKKLKNLRSLSINFYENYVGD
jgi:NLR family CARD domain-containing protein 3